MKKRILSLSLMVLMLSVIFVSPLNTMAKEDYTFYTSDSRVTVRVDRDAYNSNKFYYDVYYNYNKIGSGEVIPTAVTFKTGTSSQYNQVDVGAYSYNYGVLYNSWVKTNAGSTLHTLECRPTASFNDGVYLSVQNLNYAGTSVNFSYNIYFYW